jgi:hypothetical protein
MEEGEGPSEQGPLLTKRLFERYIGPKLGDKLFIQVHRTDIKAAYLEEIRRGFGKFQQTQMKRVDAPIPDLFRHIRSSVNILEKIILHPYQPPRETLVRSGELPCVKLG